MYVSTDRGFFRGFLQTRNLNILRDIHRAIQEAKRSNKKEIEFHDVDGTRWLLKKVAPTPRPQPQQTRQFI